METHDDDSDEDESDDSYDDLDLSDDDEVSLLMTNHLCAFILLDMCNM